jgi:hypothetical protein
MRINVNPLIEAVLRGERADRVYETALNPNNHGPDEMGSAELIDKVRNRAEQLGGEYRATSEIDGKMVHGFEFEDAISLATFRNDVKTMFGLETKLSAGEKGRKLLVFVYPPEGA